MVKLYPPILEGTLPAFYSDEKGIVNITIPFSMNRAVSHTQIGGFELKIKTVQNGNFLYTLQTFDFNDYDVENVNTYVTFKFHDDNNVLKLGQFYKFQLAYWYIDEETKTDSLNKYYHGEYSLEDYITAIQEAGAVGYYSTTSVAKFTTKPTVEILNLRKGFLNAYTFSYVGRYSQTNQEIPLWDNNGDPIYKTDEFGALTDIQQTYLHKRDTTEKVYMYRFDVYDANDNIVYTSGDCLHNSSTDTNIDFSEDTYALKSEIPNDTIYYIQYTITTANKLVISTPRYKLIKRAGLESELAINLNAELNFNNGYVNLSVANERDERDLPVAVTGSFLLLRSSSDGNFEDWQEMFKFKLANQRLPDGILYKDFTVEQGKSYKYAIQQYSNNNLFSSKITSNSVYVDFEDAFLFDGQRQLKIRFNPKMSKFTNNRLESKTETIGSKYPFIFRNGQVNYHEFSLSGLISYLSDEEFLFLTREELNVEDLHRHASNSSRFIPDFENEVSDNVARERLFKMKVLEWLNDGQPKVFRSPTEGNFIVRLMKTSLAPQEKLGRLLHTFSSTAYEVAEFEYANLCNMKFIDPSEPNNLIVNWVTVDLSKVMPARENRTVNINPDTYETIKNVQTVRFDNMTPGEKIRITYANGTSEVIIIGPTGRLYLDKVTPINSIIIEPMYQRIKAFNEREYLNKEYYRRTDSNTYYVSYHANAAGQPIIIPDKTYQQKYYKKVNSRTTGLITFSYLVEQTNAFDNIQNVIIEDSHIREFIGEHNILREISEIPRLDDSNYKIPDSYIHNPKADIIDMYYLKISRRPVESTWREDNGTYYIYYEDGKSDIKLNINKVHPYTLFFNHNWDSGDGPYYDEFYSEFGNVQMKQYAAYDPSITINEEKIIVDRDMIISLKDFDDIKELISGNGVIVEIAYLERKINYFIEEKYAPLMGENSFKTIEQNFKNSFTTSNTPNYNDFLAQYIRYCNKLYNVLHEQ